MSKQPKGIRGRVPLAEVSGLTVLRYGGTTRLVAVGDARVSLALADVAPDGSLGEWSVLTTHDVAAPPGRARFFELEATAADGSGTVWVLTEETSWLGGVDVDQCVVVATARLETSTIPELHDDWTRPGASRGEGLALLVDGHVLVAKEKDAAGLVELGPVGDEPLGVSAETLLPAGEAFDLRGDELVALAWWPLPKAVARRFHDLSDLAPDHEGGLWLLSDQSTCYGRLVLPLLPGAEVAVVDVVDLPRDVRKPEGLAFLPGGLVAVAEDRHDTDDNLWLVSR